MATNSLRFGYCYGNSSRGPRGTPGPQGVNGATGPTGPGISALVAYGEIYDDSLATSNYTFTNTLTTSPGWMQLTTGTKGEFSSMDFINADPVYGDAFKVKYAGPYQLVISGTIEQRDPGAEKWLGVFVNDVLVSKSETVFVINAASDNNKYATLSQTILLDLNADDIVSFKFRLDATSYGNIIGDPTGATTSTMVIHHFQSNLTSLRGVINLYGSTGPPQITSGLTGATGVGPFQVAQLFFDSDDLFTYTSISGATGGGAIIGNKVADYLFAQPPVVLNSNSNSVLKLQNGKSFKLTWDQFTPEVRATSFPVAPRNDPNLGVNFDWLPYIDSFRFQYQKDGSPVWHTIRPGDPSLPFNTWRQYVANNVTANGGPNALNQIFFNAISISGGVTITSPDVSLSNPMIVDIGEKDGLGSAFRFRFAFTNQSPESSGNWVYWPDPSSAAAVSFNDYGKAHPPTTIDLSSIAFNDLRSFGLGAVPADGLDDILDTSYGNPNLSVSYGGGVTGTRLTNALQFTTFGFPGPAQYDFETTLVNTQAWQDGANPPPGLKSIAFPEFRYELDLSLNPAYWNYYCRNTSRDFSDINVYAVVTPVTPECFVPIPKKSELDPSYVNTLQGDFVGLNITKNSASVTSLDTVYQRTGFGPYHPHDVVIMAPGDILHITPAKNRFETSVNYGDSTGISDFIATVRIIPPQSLVGINSNNENLSYYQLEIDSSSSIVQDLSSAWIVGSINAFNNLISGTHNTNANLQFNVSNIADITNDTNYKGYYLKADMFSMHGRDLSLSLIPDICNNGVDASGAYLPHNFKASQHYREQLTSVVKSVSSIEKPFKNIAEASSSMRIVNFSSTLGIPSGGRYFYGLELPSTFQVSLAYDVADINATWSLVDESGVLWENELIIDPTATAGGARIDRDSAEWGTWGNLPIANANTTLTFSENVSGEGRDYLTRPFSRLIARPQFQTMSSVPVNNIGFTPLAPILVDNDLSLNGLPLWWDYTWTDFSGSFGYPSPFFAVDNVQQTGIGVKLNTSNIKNVQLCVTDGSNPFTCDPSNQPLPPTLRDLSFNEELDFNEAMWANDRWWGALTTGGLGGPYLEYDASFANMFTSGGTGLKDYRQYDPSGDDITYVLSSGVTHNGESLDISGTDTEIKWIMIKLETPANVGNLGVRIDGAHPITSGEIYQNYWLFYMEEDTLGSNVYTWRDAAGTAYIPKKRNTPWLDAGNVTSTGTNSLTTFSDAQTYTGSPGNNNGCLTSNQSATNFIKAFNPTAALKRYLAIGIKQTKQVRTIELSVGTN